MKKMLKISIISSIVLTQIHESSIFADETKEKRAPIHHESINIIDGFPGGLDGPAVAGLIHFIKELKKLQLGERKSRNAPRQGKYLFEDKKHTLTELAEIEQTIEKQYAHGAINQKSYDLKKKKLNEVLKIVKKDFIDVSIPSLDQAQGSKEIVVELIEYWTKINNRSDSFMLEWGREEEGQEIAIFQERVQSFTMFDQFCTDLTLFNEDLIESCPRGFRQFLDLLHNKKK